MASESYWHFLNWATMSTQLNQMYQMKKETVKDKLTAAECVSLTNGCWTLLNQDGYMTVTAHLIENWQHKSAVLDTSPVTLLDGPQRHTPEECC